MAEGHNHLLLCGQLHLSNNKNHENPHYTLIFGSQLTLVGSGASKLKPTGTGSEILRSKLALAATECSSSRSELALAVSVHGPNSSASAAPD